MNVLEAKEEVVRLSDVRIHMEEAGFRRGRSGSYWHCGFHQDKRPSVSIRNNRAHCWTCDKIWDPIEIVMRSTGDNFMTVLRRMAAQYGISIDKDPQYNQEQRAQFRKDKINSEYWKSGILIELNSALERVKADLLNIFEINNAAAFKTLTLTREITNISSHGAHDIIREYRKHLTSDPKETKRLVMVGIKDDENARLITNELINILTRTQNVTQMAATN